jgi:predicted DNA-binding transcriptional regulator YafY
MLGKLLEGDANREELVAHVEATIEDAYDCSPFDSFARDLRLLRNLGFCIRFSRAQRVYKIEKLDHPVLQLHLSKPALEALALLKITFQDLPHQERVQALVQEIEARLPAATRARLEREPLPRLAFQPADAWEKYKDNLSAVERAMERHQLLEFSYLSPRHPEGTEPKLHQVEPYNLEYRDGHLYFEGYNLKTDKVYSYRVDRVIPGTVKLLPDMFVPRSKIASLITIRYRLSAEIARFGASIRFRNQREEKQPDGSTVVTGEASNLFEAMRKLLRYGSHCRVLEPPELVELMRTEATKLAALYESKEK